MHKVLILFVLGIGSLLILMVTTPLLALLGRDTPQDDAKYPDDLDCRSDTILYHDANTGVGHAVECDAN